MIEQNLWLTMKEEIGPNFPNVLKGQMIVNATLFMVGKQTCCQRCQDIERCSKCFKNVACHGTKKNDPVLCLNINDKVDLIEGPQHTNNNNNNNKSHKLKILMNQ